MQELARNSANSFSDNVDPLLPEAVPRSSLPDWRAFSSRLVNIGRQVLAAHPRAAFAEFLFERLADDDSRNLLLELLAYRILGHRKVKLRRNGPVFRGHLFRVKKLVSSREIIKAGDRFELNLLDMRALGYEVRLFTTPTAAPHLFQQGQYEYSSGGAACKAGTGDIVIDAGGCWGDSTLYFATLVGDGGKVYSFELIPANLEILRRNFALNPNLISRMEVVEKPIWEYSGRTLYYLDRGPASYVGWERTSDKSIACETLAIDDLVRKKNLPRVDFIKMDIAGAEVPALKGAENTLKRFKPKLAISAYHKPDDLESIPRYLESLGLGYSYYLEHHTIHLYETVLYAVAHRQS